MKTLSVKEYAQSINHTVQSVTWQIRNNKLPIGVISEKIGSTYIIKVEI